MTLPLSTLGLSNVVCPHEFSFIVGTEAHCCSAFIAGFLSPKISAFHCVDPTMWEYVVRTKDQGNEFEEFLKLELGTTMTIPLNRILFHVELANELENAELLSQIKGSLQQPLALSSFLDRMRANPSTRTLL
jgi:hypothetical protein